MCIWFGLIWLGVCSRFPRVCSRFGLSGKQKRGCLPVFVYVLGGFGNKCGRGEDVSALRPRERLHARTITCANDNDAVNSTRRWACFVKNSERILKNLSNFYSL